MEWDCEEEEEIKSPSRGEEEVVEEEELVELVVDEDEDEDWAEWIAEEDLEDCLELRMAGGKEATEAEEEEVTAQGK